MSALNLMVKTVRDDFPQATVWYNEAVPPMRDGVDVYGASESGHSQHHKTSQNKRRDGTLHKLHGCAPLPAGNQHNYSIPSGLSWISIDMYHTGKGMLSGSALGPRRQALILVFFPFLSPHRRAVSLICP